MLLGEQVKQKIGNIQSAPIFSLHPPLTAVFGQFFIEYLGSVTYMAYDIYVLMES